MIVLDKENIKPFDCDDTLVMHNETCQNRVAIKDPQSGELVYLGVNQAMVKLLKEEHYRGGTVIVWSRGGYAWANAIVEALGLQNYVTLVMSKPLVYFDDSDVSDWLKDRIYIGPNTKYKV